MGKLGQRVHAGLSSNDDIATMPSVATVGAPTRHVLFSAKRHTAVSTAASDDFNFNAIDKHGI
jgi:hypothetical protein